MIGTRLSHFRIVAKLGEGGMGVVYRAEDDRLRRPVALKVLPPELVANEERRLRFTREARAAAAVSHPNIAAIYEVDEAEGVVFIAMELVEGKTLRELIGGRPMPIKDALRMAAEMAEGLAHAHLSRVIHRDFKPDNVMVRPDQHVKILDFGLAKLVQEVAGVESSELSKLETISGEVTRAGKVLGTPAYMSPEQARGQELDPRSDIFAFGATLYEMATGRVPFRGKASADTLSGIIRDEPVAPSQLNPEVPLKLEEIIGKCLEKDPEDRYQHADELAVDLRRLRKSTDTGVQAIRVPGGPPALPTGLWARVTAIGAKQAAFMTALAALLTAGSLVTWRAMRAEGRFQQGDLVLVADFEDAAGRGDLGSAIRDGVEHMLAQSRFVEVIRGERRRGFLAGQGSEAAAKIDRETAHRLCAQGGCAGFVVGEIRREGDSYSLKAEVYRTGKQAAVTSVSSGPHPEDELLMAAHGAVLEIRKALGEAPQAVSDTLPPTTRSLRAYQAFSLANEDQIANEVVAALCKKALEIDPGFVQARQRMGSELWSLGDFRGWREAVGEVYRQSAALPEPDRMRAEVDFLEANYEFDVEVGRLKAAARLHPEEEWPQTWLCTLYPDGYESLHLAEHSCREAYRLSPRGATLNNLCERLLMQGKEEEIERVVADFRGRKGATPMVDRYLFHVHLLRGDEERIRQTFGRVSRELGWVSSYMNIEFLDWLLATGRLREARSVASSVWRVAEDVGELGERYAADLRQAWLEARRSGRPASVRPESIEMLRSNLRQLPRFAAFSIDISQASQLEQVIHEHETVEKDSQSRFVREALQFARGCLALVQGDAQRARLILEPLARKSTLPLRHQVLARAYQELGLLKEAAAEYELVVENPYLRWSDGIFAVPSLVVLEQFRLAQVYERMVDSDRARHWYERFLEDWKDADPDIPELIEARKRLALIVQDRTEAQSGGK